MLKLKHAYAPKAHQTTIGFDGKRRVDFSDADELINIEARSVGEASRAKARRPRKANKAQTSNHR